MTCPEAVSRLDDLADNALPDAEAVKVRDHIQSCDACRREYEQTIRLKRLLGGMTAPDPGDAYFQETTSLILARTVDAAPEQPERISADDLRREKRGALLRAILSVAASIAILVSAILIGSSPEQQVLRSQTEHAPVLATADLRDVVGPHDLPVYSHKDRVRLARGMMLIGSPGFLGRFAGLPDMFNATDLQ